MGELQQQQKQQKIHKMKRTTNKLRSSQETNTKKNCRRVLCILCYYSVWHMLRGNGDRERLLFALLSTSSKWIKNLKSQQLWWSWYTIIAMPHETLAFIALACLQFMWMSYLACCSFWFLYCASFESESLFEQNRSFIICFPSSSSSFHPFCSSFSMAEHLLNELCQML